MRRLIIEEEQTVKLSSITNGSHVGFFEGSEKGYIALVNEGYKGISSKPFSADCCNSCYGSKQWPLMEDAIIDLSQAWKISSFYVFNTRKELYKWLSE